MKHLNQFCIILCFSLAGEVLNRVIPLPIPASVYGILLLFLALCLGMVKLEQVKQTADFLIDLLPLLFVPSVVGLLENWIQIKSAVVPVLVLVLVTTALTFGITGRVTQWILDREGKNHG